MRAADAAADDAVAAGGYDTFKKDDEEEDDNDMVVVVKYAEWFILVIDAFAFGVQFCFVCDNLLTGGRVSTGSFTYRPFHTKMLMV